MNLVKDAAVVLETVAPKLGLALGGPLGGMAGGLLSMGIGKLLGKQDAAGAPVPATQKEIETALTAGDPQTLLAVKNIQADLEKHMADLGVEDEQLRFADTANARGREMSLKDNTPHQLAWMVVGGFMVISLVQLVGLIGFADAVAKVPPQGWLLIGNISGYLASEAKQAGAYYFGSSAGSQSKDATLADLAKGS